MQRKMIFFVARKSCHAISFKGCPHCLLSYKESIKTSFVNILYFLSVISRVAMCSKGLMLSLKYYVTVVSFA